MTAAIAIYRDTVLPAVGSNGMASYPNSIYAANLIRWPVDESVYQLRMATVRALSEALR